MAEEGQAFVRGSLQLRIQSAPNPLDGLQKAALWRIPSCTTAPEEGDRNLASLWALAWL